ncbi:MAG: LysE family transporter [Myxococcales bacterium]|nr:LysE family transporter [Myxococcales bacterium]
MLVFFLIGFAAGALTGVPIGPVNVAVIDAAYRYTMRRALAVGLGGAIADALYCALGVAGVTPVLRSNPSIPPVLYAISGVVLLGYGVLTVRTRPMVPVQHESAPTPRASREAWSGFKIGITLIILNPAAIVTWVVIVGSFIPDASSVEGLITAAGVFVGSFVWFALVAILTQKGKSAFGDKALWIPRAVGIALIVYALYLLSKALRYFLGF